MMENRGCSIETMLNTGQEERAAGWEEKRVVSANFPWLETDDKEERKAVERTRICCCEMAWCKDSEQQERERTKDNPEKRKRFLRSSPLPYLRVLAAEENVYKAKSVIDDSEENESGQLPLQSFPSSLSTCSLSTANSPNGSNGKDMTWSAPENNVGVTAIPDSLNPECLMSPTSRHALSLAWQEDAARLWLKRLCPGLKESVVNEWLSLPARDRPRVLWHHFHPTCFHVVNGEWVLKEDSVPGGAKFIPPPLDIQAIWTGVEWYSSGNDRGDTGLNKRRRLSGVKRRLSSSMFGRSQSFGNQESLPTDVDPLSLTEEKCLPWPISKGHESPKRVVWYQVLEKLRACKLTEFDRESLIECVELLLREKVPKLRFKHLEEYPYLRQLTPFLTGLMSPLAISSVFEAMNHGGMCERLSYVVPGESLVNNGEPRPRSLREIVRGLEPIDCLFYTLFLLRTGVSMEVACEIFGIHNQVGMIVFETWVLAMYHIIHVVFPPDPKEQIHVGPTPHPSAAFETDQFGVLICYYADATEIVIQVPHVVGIGDSVEPEPIVGGPDHVHTQALRLLEQLVASRCLFHLRRAISDECVLDDLGQERNDDELEGYELEMEKILDVLTTRFATIIDEGTTLFYMLLDSSEQSNKNNSPDDAGSSWKTSGDEQEDETSPKNNRSGTFAKSLSTTSLANYSRTTHHHHQPMKTNAPLHFEQAQREDTKAFRYIANNIHKIDSDLVPLICKITHSLSVN